MIYFWICIICFSGESRVSEERCRRGDWLYVGMVEVGRWYRGFIILVFLNYV